MGTGYFLLRLSSPFRHMVLVTPHQHGKIWKLKTDTWKHMEEIAFVNIDSRSKDFLTICLRPWYLVHPQTAFFTKKSGSPVKEKNWKIMKYMHISPVKKVKSFSFLSHSLNLDVIFGHITDFLSHSSTVLPGSQRPRINCSKRRKYRHFNSYYPKT